MIKGVKYIVLVCCTTILLSGCGSNNNDFESNTNSKLNILRSDTVQLKQTVTELQQQIDIIKQHDNIDTTSKLTSADIKFSSIKVLTNNGSKNGNNVYIKTNTKFNLKIDIMNTTNENVNQYVCQVYLKSLSGNELMDIYQSDISFNALPKDIRKDIEFKDIPISNAKLKHILVAEIKDQYGNIITTFEKELKVN